MKAESESGDPRWGLQRPHLIVRRPRPTYGNPPGLGARPGAAEEEVRPGGSDLRTLRKAPSLLADSVRRRPPLFPIPSSVCSFPSSLGVPSPCHTRPPADPGGAKLAPGRSFPSRALHATPHPPSPKSWVQCLLSHSNASNEGASRRPQCGQGALEGGYLLSPALTFTQGERYTSQGRRVPQSRHYGCLTECVWHFF